ncbi:DUF6641 family protein [Terasakiella pusilla]|uniref:DUF6641 family protein n=1 Tax=Terasakiella pusilla TaxID=64973 RepID=UPI00048EB08B|nr:DUF6641 family protein [Terasakiella pusilla]
MALNLSDKKKPLVSETRRRSPKAVFLDSLQSQISLLDDPSYKISRYRYTDHEDDNGKTARNKKLIAATPRKWWWQEEDGTFMLELRYGSSYALEIEAGKSSIICGPSESDVREVLEQVIKMVENGQLDKQIADCKEKARRRVKA